MRNHHRTSDPGRTGVGHAASTEVLTNAQYLGSYLVPRHGWSKDPLRVVKVDFSRNQRHVCLFKRCKSVQGPVFLDRERAGHRNCIFTRRTELRLPPESMQAFLALLLGPSRTKCPFLALLHLVLTKVTTQWVCPGEAFLEFFHVRRTCRPWTEVLVLLVRLFMPATEGLGTETLIAYRAQECVRYRCGRGRSRGRGR